MVVVFHSNKIYLLARSPPKDAPLVALNHHPGFGSPPPNKFPAPQISFITIDFSHQDGAHSLRNLQD